MKLHELYTPETLRKMRDSLPHRGLVMVEEESGHSYSMVNRVLGGIENPTISETVEQILAATRKVIRAEELRIENLTKENA